MLIGKTWAEQDDRVQTRYAKQRRPHSWFAWRPVTLDDGRTAFLHRVRRFRTSVLDRWHYMEAR